MEPFNDRSDAGRQLASRMEHLRDQDVVVVGLPRGGVPRRLPGRHGAARTARRTARTQTRSAFPARIGLRGYR